MVVMKYLLVIILSLKRYLNLLNCCTTQHIYLKRQKQYKNYSVKWLFLKLRELNYTILCPINFENEEVSLNMNAFGAEIVAVLKLNYKKRYCSISQCNN